MDVTKLLSGQSTQLGTFLHKMDYCAATNHTSCQKTKPSNQNTKPKCKTKTQIMTTENSTQNTVFPFSAATNIHLPVKRLQPPIQTTTILMFSVQF